jgi:small subunit ribosomal protein S4
LCRREGIKLFLKGDRCYSPKCAVERRPYPPGMAGRKRVRDSEYRNQLREKQKAKRVYGILEKQFRGYYQLANRASGITGENLLRILETRLDNVVYRLGFAASRDEARQLIRHRHFMVNDARVTIPSYRVRPGDVISVAEKAKDFSVVKAAILSSAKIEVQGWLEVDVEHLKGKVLAQPEREQIDLPVREQLIVELYSK